MKIENATAAAAAAATAAAQAASTATAAALVSSKASEAVAIIGNDISWMKGSLAKIELTLKELSGAFVTTAAFGELEKITEDKEIRLRTLERNTNIWVGGLAMLTFVIPILLKIFLK